MLLALVVSAAAIHFHLRGKLPPDSPRYWYFVYMAALVALALLVVPWPRLAVVVLSLATLETAFGLGTAYLYKLRLVDETVFARIEEAEYRFRWHPLLQGVPIPSGSGPEERDPYHNALGRRGRERTPQSLEGKATIALIGVQASVIIGGTLLIETIFGLPGIGALMLRALGAFDMQTIQALAVVYAITVQIVNLVISWALQRINPRLRSSS